MTVSPKDVFIVGAGKLGALLHDCMVGDDGWRCAGFIDDGKAGGALHGLPVFGSSDPGLPRGGRAILAVGFPGVRRQMIERVSSLGFDWQAYVDRRSLVGQEASLAQGVLVLSFAMVASGVTVGPFSYFSSYSHAGTGAKIGAHVSLMGGASVGESVIGDDCVLGLKSACIDGAVLGNRVTVAPFTLVRRGVPDDSLVAGNPARVFRRNAASRGKLS